MRFIGIFPKCFVHIGFTDDLRHKAGGLSRLTEMMLEKAPRLEKVLNSEYEEEVKEAAREALDKLNH